MVKIYKIKFWHYDKMIKSITIEASYSEAIDYIMAVWEKIAEKHAILSDAMTYSIEEIKI